MTLISNKYINIELHVTTSDVRSWNQYPGCRRQSSDLNFWPPSSPSFAGSRSLSGCAVFLSHSSSIPPSESESLWPLAGFHQTLTAVEVAVRLLGVSRLLEECSVSVAGWLCRGMAVAVVVGGWGDGPQRVETSWDRSRAAGCCSRWDLSVFSAHRCLQHLHTALCSHKCRLFDLLKQSFPNLGGDFGGWKKQIDTL